MSTGMNALGRLLALTFLVACASERVPSRIIVEVDSDLAVPSELDLVTLEVTGQQLDGEAEANLREKGLPRTVTLRHESGPLGPVRITVRGWLGAQPIIMKEQSAWFREDAEERVRVMLARDCLQVACPEGQSCDSGRCVLIASEDPASDAAVPTDAGTVGNDASVTSDAGRDGGTVVDAGSPPPSPGMRPVCVIDRPVHNDAYQTNTTVAFRGACSDPETGQLTMGLRWASQRDGQIALGASTTGTFRSTGIHTLSLCAPDPRDAALAGCASIEVLATEGPQPAAQIISITQAGSSTPPFTTGPPIVLTGSGTGRSVTLTWVDSIHGALGTGATATIEAPAVGTHTVTLTARDRDGNEAVRSSTFTVLPRFRPLGPASQR